MVFIRFDFPFYVNTTLKSTLGCFGTCTLKCRPYTLKCQPYTPVTYTGTTQLIPLQHPLCRNE